MKLMALSVFGLLGVHLRYWLDTHEFFLAKSLGLSTYIANSLGCAIAGIVFALAMHKNYSPTHSLILIGFCGGLTTFSGYSLNIFKYFEQGDLSKAISYLVISPFLGLLFLCLFYFITKKIIL